MKLFREKEVTQDSKYPICSFFVKNVIGRANEPLLIRYNIFNCKYFAIRVHKFLKSDHDCVHDHPWNFITLILKGGYFEKLEDGSRIWRKPGSLLYRKAEFKHSVQLMNGTKIVERFKDRSFRVENSVTITSWSFVISFRVRRKWGFWNSQGWTYWKFFNSENKCD